MPLRRDQDRSQWPGWVRLGLWGIKTRRDAIFGWIALAIAVLVWAFFTSQSLFYGVSLFLENALDIREAAFWLGVLFLTVVLEFLSVLWYWGALRWVDRHDQ